MSPPAAAWACCVLAVLWGCGDGGEAGAELDGGADSGAAVDGAGPTPPMPEAPAAPAIVPCPAGWAEVGSDPPTCEPWPADGGSDECPTGWARFAGEAECVPVGEPCPEGEWPEDLPTEGEVTYVRPDVGAGSGTRESPMPLDWALGGGNDRFIALAKGTYRVDTAVIGFNVTLWGACAAETVLVQNTDAGDNAPTVAALSPEATLANLRIRGATGPGLALSTFDAVPEVDVHLEGVVIEQALGFGILVSGGGRVSGSEVVVDGTRHGPVVGAAGIDVEEGRISLQRVILRDNAALGARVTGAGGELELVDVAVLSSQPDVDGSGGDGLIAARSGSLFVTRGVIEENIGSGIGADGAGTEAQLEQVVVRRTASRRGAEGYGAIAARGANLMLRRAWLDDNRMVGLVSWDGSTLQAEDVVVRDTAPPTDRSIEAAGIAAADARATVVRASVEANWHVGIGAQGTDAELLLTDVVVSATRAFDVAGALGRGVTAQLGAQVTAERLRLQGNREVGVYASGPSRFSGTDVAIVDTAERACAEDQCPDLGAGIGVLSKGEAVVELDRFRVSRSALIGIQVLPNGRLGLRRGWVTDQPVGVNVQVEGFDVNRIVEEVIFDNERNLVREHLPTPGDVGVLDL